MNPKKTTIPEEDLIAMHTVGKVVDYAADSSKTEECHYVTGVNCIPQNAKETFLATKKKWKKTGGNVAFHAYQSFKEGEVDAKTAHEIGVKLATELWEDRFEVIVATHQNTSHFHNHIIINSVSFADGKRYNDCKATYGLIRDTSDRLCREYGLSVIRHPGQNPKKHYAEWKAEKEGQPTLRGTIREAIDMAIRGTDCRTDFLEAMTLMGFIIDLSGKHAKIKHKGSDRFVRFDTLGDGYDEEDILDRLYEDHRLVYPDPPPQQSPQKIFENEDGSPATYGYTAVYRCYHAALEQARADPEHNRKLYFFVRMDEGRITSISEQVQLLCEHHIENMEQLMAYRDIAVQGIFDSKAGKQESVNWLRRAKYAGDTVAISQAKFNIDLYNRRIRKYYREIQAYDSVKERSEAIRDKLITIKNEDFRGGVIRNKVKNKNRESR